MKKSESNKNKNIDKLQELTNSNIKRFGICILAIIILIIVIVLVKNNYEYKHETINDLRITYDKGKVLSFDNFSKTFKKEQVITIKNTSNENKTYSLEWIKVKNTVKEQNKLLYEIKCTGDRCATLSKSQVPVASSLVYPQCIIEAGKIQKYTVVFEYSGSEKDALFKGTLQINSKKVNTKGIEQRQQKEREKMSKDLEKENKNQ